MQRNARFARFAWLVLAWNVLVILWGAFVRASGSGAGCGSHWPLCNGEVIPPSPGAQTIIEFTHRLTSGLALIAVVVMLVWSLRLFPKDHMARRAAWFSLFFILLEAALGAGLVLFDFVAKNASTGRAVYLPLHLTNTLLLLASITFTAWLGRCDSPPNPFCRMTSLDWWGVLAIIVACASGALAALGDTLFPSVSFSDGLRQDFSAASSALLRIRLLHPVVAIAAGAFLGFLSLSSVRTAAHGAGRSLGALVVIQLAAGIGNVWLLAPIWMQIFHLLIGCLLWIAFLILVLHRAAPNPPPPTCPAGP